MRRSGRERGHARATEGSGAANGNSGGVPERFVASTAGAHCDRNAHVASVFGQLLIAVRTPPSRQKRILRSIAQQAKSRTGILFRA
jgi:hypothetical protein